MKLLLLAICFAFMACATLPERVADLKAGSAASGVREELGTPQVSERMSPTEQLWVYFDGPTTCALRLLNDKLLPSPVCKERGQWSAHEVAREIEAEKATRAKAAEEEKKKKKEEKKKKDDEEKLRNGPHTLIPGYNADAVGRPRPVPPTR